MITCGVISVVLLRARVLFLLVVLGFEIGPTSHTLTSVLYHWATYTESFYFFFFNLQTCSYQDAHADYKHTVKP